MLKTSRIRLEPVTAAHADVMYPILTDERIYTHLPEDAPTSVEHLRKRYEFLGAGLSPDGAEHWLNWMLFLRETGKAMGFFQATVRSVDCSIAYALNPAFWGSGFATEAGVAVITYLLKRFDIPLVRAEIRTKNQASIALVKRLGFTFIRHDLEENDDIYELMRSAWSDLQAGEGRER